MNNFNTVFSVVQKRCLDHKSIAGPEIQKIAAEVGLSIDRLKFYLDCIVDIGLIEFSQRDKKISLTEKGEHTAQLFS